MFLTVIHQYSYLDNYCFGLWLGPVRTVQNVTSNMAVAEECSATLPVCSMELLEIQMVALSLCGNTYEMLILLLLCLCKRVLMGWKRAKCIAVATVPLCFCVLHGQQ